MKERPILFSAPMVRALLDGSKTQTRRIMKPQPESTPGDYPGPKGHRWPANAVQSMVHIEEEMQKWTGLAGDCCPYGDRGDRLWVRETWRSDESLEHKAPRDFSGWPVKYAADGTVLRHGAHFGGANGKTRVSIHMPRWASRILLEIVSVRVERLNDCSEADAIAEGIGLNESAIGVPMTDDDRTPVAIGMYRALWETINGAGSWAANPFVWVVEFKRIEAGQ